MELARIIARVDELKEELDSLRPIREDRLNRLNQKLKLDWNYHSNSIEGNTLSKSETKSFILWGITAKGKPFRDYLEMKGHNEALNKLYQIVEKDVSITEKLIKEFHQMILVEPYTDEHTEISPGEWKTIPNYLYSTTGERIDFEPPEDVPVLMNELINWLNNHISPPKRKKKKYDLHPLLIAAGFHTQFIQIHPFGDGNGRMARILTNLILMICGYVPAIIKLDTRTNYYTAINISSLDSPEALATFIGNELIQSMELAIQAAKGENIEELDDIDKELQLLEKRVLADVGEGVLGPKERVSKIAKKVYFPFVDSVVLEMDKFSNFFDRKRNSLSFNRHDIIYSEESKDYFLKKNESEVIESTTLSCELIQLKGSSQDFSIRLRFAIYFKVGEYIIRDNLTRKKQSYSYSEIPDSKEINAWVQAIKKAVFEKIKTALPDA